jgi:hypothetical protein
MPKKQRLIVSTLLALGLGVIIIGFMAGGGNDVDITVDGVEEIDAIIPEREASILQRDRVGIDLQEGYVAALTFEINGQDVEIPSNQLDDTLQSLGVYTFKPGEGKIIEQFPPTATCVRATYWPVEDRNDVAQIRWCFEVL